jgi:putative membrane protein
MTVAEGLATANMLLSAATAIFLIAGWRAIRRRAIEQHRNRMIGAFACSTLFMVLFVTRFVVYGFHPFAGHGGWRVGYYITLFAHEPLAVISVPMAIVTFVLGLRRSKVHTELARPTIVVWLISAVTGVLLYLQLYVVGPLVR